MNRVCFIGTMGQQVQGQYRIYDAQKQDADNGQKKNRVVLVNQKQMAFVLLPSNGGSVAIPHKRTQGNPGLLPPI